MPADLEELAGLALDALAGVDDHDCRIHSCQHPVRILGEVLVAGSVQQVDPEVPVVELQHRGADGDAALLLQFHPVGGWSPAGFCVLSPTQPVGRRRCRAGTSRSTWSCLRPGARRSRRSVAGRSRQWVSCVLFHPIHLWRRLESTCTPWANCPSGTSRRIQTEEAGRVTFHRLGRKRKITAVCSRLAGQESACLRWTLSSETLRYSRLCCRRSSNTPERLQQGRPVRPGSTRVGGANLPFCQDIRPAPLTFPGREDNLCSVRVGG